MRTVSLQQLNRFNIKIRDYLVNKTNELDVFALVPPSNFCSKRMSTVGSIEFAKKIEVA